jgi:hypothetical protein
MKVIPFQRQQHECKPLKLQEWHLLRVWLPISTSNFLVIHLFGVPSKSIKNLSIAVWSLTSRLALINAGAMISLTFETALVTPLRLAIFSTVYDKVPFPSQAEPLSRNSSASWIPVEAPEGTAALCNPVSEEISRADHREREFLPVIRSTSTVGLPRES